MKNDEVAAKKINWLQHFACVVKFDGFKIDFDKNKRNDYIKFY